MEKAEEYADSAGCNERPQQHSAKEAEKVSGNINTEMGKDSADSSKDRPKAKPTSGCGATHFYHKK